MHTIKMNVHDAGCDCNRAPGCRGKYVVNLPDTDAPPRVFTDLDEAVAKVREFAAGGVPVGQPGVHGPIRVPDDGRLGWGAA